MESIQAKFLPDFFFFLFLPLTWLGDYNKYALTGFLTNFYPSVFVFVFVLRIFGVFMDVEIIRAKNEGVMSLLLLSGCHEVKAIETKHWTLLPTQFHLLSTYRSIKFQCCLSISSILQCCRILPCLCLHRDSCVFSHHWGSGNLTLLFRECVSIPLPSQAKKKQNKPVQSLFWVSPYLDQFYTGFR